MPDIERQPITKVQSKDPNQNNADIVFDLGATFDHVYYSDDNEYTLKDFFNYMKTFLESPFFIQYSENEPITDNVKVWYDLSIS